MSKFKFSDKANRKELAKAHGKGYEEGSYAEQDAEWADKPGTEVLVRGYGRKFVPVGTVNPFQ